MAAWDRVVEGRKCEAGGGREDGGQAACREKRFSALLPNFARSRLLVVTSLIGISCYLSQKVYGDVGESEQPANQPSVFLTTFPCHYHRAATSK